MARIKLISIILLWFGLAACEEHEELWDLPPAGKETYASVNMGSNYDKVIFYNFTSKESDVRDLNSWHIAFSAANEQHHIMLNGGAEVWAFNTHDTSFGKPYGPPPPTLPWMFDNPNGKPDSTAFSEWYDEIGKKSRNFVYILDLGKNAKPRNKKICIRSVSTTNYVVQFANLDGSDLEFMTLEKKPGSTRIYLNLNTKSVVPFEPNHQWDVVFTRYRHIYYDKTPPEDYYVVGPLLNPFYSQAGMTTSHSFESIDAKIAATIPLSTKLNQIGFEWKYFDLNGSGKYIIDKNRVYILKDKNGEMYKLRFLDFYDQSGNKGVPSFSFQRL